MQNVLLFCTIFSNETCGRMRFVNLLYSYVPASELEPPKQTKVCGIVLNRSSGFENIPNWSTRIFQTPKLNVGKCLQMWQNKAPWQMSRWTMWRKKFVDFTKFCKRNLYSDVRFGCGFKFVGRCEWLQVCWFWTIIDYTFDPRFDGWKKIVSQSQLVLKHINPILIDSAHFCFHRRFELGGRNIAINPLNLRLRR